MNQPAVPDTVKRELEVEQAHVDAVYNQLKRTTRAARQTAREGQALYRSDRTNYVREEDGTALFERDAFSFQAARRLATLDAEHEGLVFGRLDRTDGEVRYIGRIGVRTDDYEPLVIDWRAPAAEPFYRATPADPMDIVRRRVLRCRSDVVVGIEDDLLDTSVTRDDLVIIGDGALMAALTRARGAHMRDIVATIQAEQDEAIRAPYQGVTIISGGPGTGKTIVALHRTAYLLYSNRRRFENGGVLVVGPSALFMNYIERVLPSLGEDSVTLHSVGSVASDVLGVTADRVDTAAAATVKGSLRMRTVLKRAVAEPLGTPGQQPQLRVSVKGDVLTVDPDRLTAIRREVLAALPVNRGRDAAQKALIAELWQQVPDNGDGRAELAEEPDTATETPAPAARASGGFDAASFADYVSDLATFKMFLNAWWPPLTAPQVLRRFADRAFVAQVANGVLSAAEQDALAASYPASEWTVADTALLDELVHLLGPAPQPEDTEVPLFLEGRGDVDEVVTTFDRYNPAPEVDPDAEAHTTFAHILVDEAQDVTPMQWRMLRRRGTQASWTIVGDPAQSSWPNLDESGRAITELIGSAPSRRFHLSTNYRSPAEVFDLAASVVQRDFPQADLPHAVRSTGIQPSLLETNGDALPGRLAGIVGELAGQVDGTVGVIVPRGRLAALADELAQQPSFTAVSGRVSLLNPLEAKGLEYDGVVVVAPDEIVAESSGGTRVLYVALTRPTQRLVTLDVMPAGPLKDGARASWRESLG